MKRLLAAVLCLVLVCAAAARAAEPEQALWTRSEGDGDYVTIRVPCPEGEQLPWAQTRKLCVRYADTGEPVALCSNYYRGYLFATVPAAQAGRTLEAGLGEPVRFADHITVWEGVEYYDAPIGTDELNLRGVLRGDGSGNLNAGAVITRAEAFALIVRLLGIPEEGEIWAEWYDANGKSTGYDDVAPGAWYVPVAAAARACGLAAPDALFHPERPVTRGEFTVMLYRAMRAVGWLEAPQGDEKLVLADGEDLPDWAREAYLAFDRGDLGIVTFRDTGGRDSEGFPLQERLAEPGRGATRGEIIEFLYSALRRLPWYPLPEAIEWGFDRAMPVIDGSTSTYPYTKAVYGAFFSNFENHPQYPESHSKSHESYQRLIDGAADVLFAATRPSEALKAQAAEAGVQLECIPIAYDAMVFFTNAENPVLGLTQRQIQDLYVYGKYTNWNQVGGPNAQLLPYRRNADSGSHALMEQYFLEGGKLSLSPNVHNVLTSYAMSSALTDVAQALRTDPAAYAIGYSVFYYYVNSSWLLDDAGGGELKLLSVDGVMPSDSTIADGSYPLAGYNYVVLRSDEPEDSPARRLAAFMLGEAGQSRVANAGFGPLSGGPKADFERDFPDWSPDEIFPAGSSYVVLAWDRGSAVLRASGLVRSVADGRWHELVANQCPAPAGEGVAAAVLGPPGCTVVFGSVGRELRGDLTVRLSYDGGQVLTQTVYPGRTFHFLLEGQVELEGLELLARDGQSLGSWKP